MELANRHMAQMLNEVQEQVLNEGRAVTREKAAERIRAKLPEPQKTIDQVAREATKKGKARYHKIAGPESSGDSLADEEEEPLEHGQE